MSLFRIYPLLVSLSCFGLTNRELTFIKEYAASRSQELEKKVELDKTTGSSITKAIERHWKNKQDNQKFLNSMAITIELFEQFNGPVPEVQSIKQEIKTLAQEQGFPDPFELIKPYLKSYETQTNLVQNSSSEYMATFFHTLNAYLDPLEAHENYEQLLLILLKSMPSHTVYDYVTADEQIAQKTLIVALETLSLDKIPEICKQLKDTLPLKDALARVLLLKKYADYVNPKLHKKIFQAEKELEDYSQSLMLETRITKEIKPFIEYIGAVRTIFSQSKQLSMSYDAIINLLQSQALIHKRTLSTAEEKALFDKQYARFICLSRDTLPALYLYRANNAGVLCGEYLDFIKEFFIISGESSSEAYAHLVQKVFGWRKKECTTFPLKAKIDLANFFEYFVTKDTVFTDFRSLLETPLTTKGLVDFTAIKPLTSANAKSYFTEFEKKSLKTALTYFYLVKNIRELEEFVKDLNTQKIAHDSALISFTLCYLAEAYNNLLKNDKKPTAYYQKEILDWVKSTGLNDLEDAFSSLRKLVSSSQAQIDSSLSYIFGVPEERLAEFETEDTQNRLKLVNAYLNGVYEYQISQFSSIAKADRSVEINRFLRDIFIKINPNALEYLQRDPAGLWSKISPEEPIQNQPQSLQELYMYLAYLWDRLSA